MLIMNYRCGEKLKPQIKIMKKRPGFTLIELIVSISVITIITAIFLANYRTATKRSDLRMTAQRVVSDIRLAQNYSLGLTSYGPEGMKTPPTGGWGVVFDLANLGNKQYVIFADDNGNKVFNAGESIESYGAVITKLPENTIIDSISIGHRVDVNYLPPDPIVTLSGSAGTHQSVDIVLRDTQANQTKTIRVNFLGLAEVIDD